MLRRHPHASRRRPLRWRIREFPIEHHHEGRVDLRFCANGALDSKRQNRRVHRYPYIFIYSWRSKLEYESTISTPEAGRHPAYLADLNSVVCGEWLGGNLIRNSRIANIEYRHESKASRRCDCAEATRLSKWTPADFRCRRRSRPEPLGSSWSHSAAQRLTAFAWSSVERQTQYFRSGRISDPWVEVRISCRTWRSDEGHSYFVCSRAAKKRNFYLQRPAASLALA